MQATVVRKFKFDAAHHLPNYPGKCRNVHGHTWFVETGITGSIDAKTGFVVDFSDLKLAMQPILDNLDHRDLNVNFDNPTAEWIAQFILMWLRESWLPHYDGSKDLLVEFVRVWESPDSYVEVK